MPALLADGIERPSHGATGTPTRQTRANSQIRPARKVIRDNLTQKARDHPRRIQKSMTFGIPISGCCITRSAPARKELTEVLGLQGRKDHRSPIMAPVESHEEGAVGVDGHPLIGRRKPDL
jgi:hypothetical protein